MKKIALITGAAGFVGKHVCHKFAMEGYSVIGIGRGGESKDQLTHWGVDRWIEGSITADLLTRVDVSEFPSVIVHCAGSGSVGQSFTSPYTDYMSSVDSLAKVLEWVRLNRNDANCRIVLTSSAAVYGNQNCFELNEDAELRPASPYGYHKLMAEVLLRSYSDHFGIKTSIVRLFSVYGDSLKKQLLWDAFKKFKNGNAVFFGSGNELRDWIHIDDASRLLYTASTSAVSDSFEVFNGTGEKSTIRNVINLLAGLLEYHGNIEFNMIEHQGNPRSLIGSATKAKSRLNWEPQVGLVDGLRRYAEWTKNQRYE